MAVGGSEVIDLGFVATAAMTKYRFVEQLTGDRQVRQSQTAGGKVIGVAQHDVSSGDAALGAHVNVRLMGISIVEADAAVAVGDFVTSSADGQAVPVAVSVGLKEVAGLALSAAANAGEFVTVLLLPAASRNTATT